MGFSFDEMAKLTIDEYIDIIEMDIEYMNLGGDGAKEEPLPEIIEATQENIDAFFT